MRALNERVLDDGVLLAQELCQTPRSRVLDSGLSKVSFGVH